MPHVGARNFNTRVDDLAKQALEVLRLHQSGAEPLHARHGQKVYAQLRIEALNSLFRAPAFGNVARDFGRADDSAVLVPYRRNREGDIE